MKSKDKSLRSHKGYKLKKEDDNGIKFFQNIIDNEEESNEETNSNKSKDIDENFIIDEERLSLREIEKLIEKKKKKEQKITMLQNKTNRDDDICKITYDERKGKILDVFYQSAEELNNFLVTCEIKKVNFDEIAPKLKDKSAIFDPNEWMKSNKINERLLNFEDLSVFCKKSIKNKNKKKVRDNPKNSNNDKKEEKINNEENIKKEKLNQYLFKDNVYSECYNELRNILSKEMLAVDQRIWLNDFIKELKEIDIEKIIVEKDEDGKDNKLEIVFDLDNTCIFSFCSNADILQVQIQKNIFPQKDARMMSFSYEDKVLYNILIIRKGLKEFINYVKPLCNFHISTLGAENYGNEIKDILSEYSGAEFIRFKGRLYEEEYTKNISDLYIKRQKVLIFDDSVKVWNNKDDDIEYVINTKFFFDEECALINKPESNDDNKGDIFYEINQFLKSYRSLSYTGIKQIRNNEMDWKKQELKEWMNIPFYQFRTSDDYLYNRCYTAEYLDSKKNQFIYMKNVVKAIYCMKFIFDIEIPLAIKLIRISTLANMKFDLKYVSIEQKTILSDMVLTCGGNIYDENYRLEDEKIYLVATKRLYVLNKRDIYTDLYRRPFYVLINEKFILDTYYFMTDLRDEINEPEYTSFD
jgi:hypothetical protein